MSAAELHGGALDAAIARHGGRREEWLDLSTGINPFSWPVPDLPADAWARLPDRAALDRLVAAARAAYGVPARSSVFVAPGTQALIEALPRLLAGRTATIVAGAAGTYGEHALCCRKAGRAVRHAASPGQVRGDEALAILVNPNNPDGHVWPMRAIGELAGRLAANGGTVLVDEAFCDAQEDASVIGSALANVVVLRSFGKFFGLAGLRLGFAVASAEIVAGLTNRFGPWAVSGPALEIGARALGDGDWIRETRQRLQNDSIALAKLLENHGFSIAGRNPLFVLARHGESARIAEALARRHVLVRHFPDRPGLIRFGLCRDERQARRLEEALAAVLAEPA